MALTAPTGPFGPGLADRAPVRAVQSGWRRAWLARGVDITADIGRGGALVVAPHPDDETFGCGVAVLRKRDRGEPVTVVLASDGRHSHGGNADAAARLAAERDIEVRRACARLGVPDEDIVRLDLPDGGLEAEVDVLADRAGELIGRLRPRHVFTPVSCDGHVDHNAANLAVQRALADGGRSVEVLEYPIWLWTHWPWTRVRGATPGVLRRGLVDPVTRLREARPLLVDTEGYRIRKAEAIAEYVSQVRPGPAGEPPALSAAFVDRFLGRHEVFLPFGALRHLGREEVGSP